MKTQQATGGVIRYTHFPKARFFSFGIAFSRSRFWVRINRSLLTQKNREKILRALYLIDALSLYLIGSPSLYLITPLPCSINHKNSFSSSETKTLKVNFSLQKSHFCKKIPNQFFCDSLIIIIYNSFINMLTFFPRIILFLEEVENGKIS